MLDVSVMDSSLNMMWDSIDDSDFYKLLRKEFESLHKAIPGQDTIINKESPCFRRIEPFLDIGKINDPEELEEKFEQILSSFLAIDGRALNTLTKGKKSKMHIYC